MTKLTTSLPIVQRCSAYDTMAVRAQEKSDDPKRKEEDAEELHTDLQAI